MGTVRLAKPSDYKGLTEWDEFWGDRRQDMQRGELYVFTDGANGVIGYLSLSHSTFLNYPFISAICVKESHRRSGVATAMLAHLDLLLERARHFTSTEPGNHPANELFLSTGYTVAGILTHTNFDRSEEVFYVKE